MSNKLFDVVIVGAGMIGATLACGLNQEKFFVAVIEKKEPYFFKYDNNSLVSSLSYLSVNILKKYNIWSDLPKDKIMPYNKIEAWENKESCIKFNSESIGLSELGFMIKNKNLLKILWDFLYKSKITIISNVLINKLQKKHDYWQIFLSNGQILLTKLIVGADGANSQVRKLSGISTYGWKYEKYCLSMIIDCDHLSGNVTWQKFTSNGPLAFLPLYNNSASLIWYDNLERICQLKSLSLSQLKNEISINFPTRLICSNVKKVNYFSLKRHHAKNYVISGLALVGDAAHTINPLAGQGANLGYRDVNALIKVIVEARNQGELWEKENVLLRYQKQRKIDNNVMQIGMDLLYLIFNNELTYVKSIRNFGLKFINNNYFLKKQILRYAVGL